MNSSFSKNLKSIFFLSFTFLSERGTLLGLIGDRVEVETIPGARFEVGEVSIACLFLRIFSSNPRMNFLLYGSFILGAICIRRTCTELRRLDERERGRDFSGKIEILERRGIDLEKMGRV